MNLQQKFRKALEARGSAVVPGGPRKVIVMTRPDKPGTLFYLGSGGALRVGSTLRGSIPCSEVFKTKLIEEAGR